jgi:proton-dependent oligopeptide transporter, POT family
LKKNASSPRRLHGIILSTLRAVAPAESGSDCHFERMFPNMNPAFQIMLISWAVVAVWIVLVIYTNRKVHPKVLFALFMVELWERFSYYGNRAFLVLYVTSSVFGDNPGFGLEKTQGNAIYAAYGALVYLTPLLGGFLADRLLGFRRSIIWGAVLMAAGQFTLSASTGSFLLLYTGLASLTVGNGFFKPNISSLVSKYYPPGDARRDGAFTIFYMGINLGAFLAPLTCAAVGELKGWHYGFLLAGSGMVVGLLIFLWTVYSGWLENYADPPAQAKNAKIGSIPLQYVIYAGSLALLPIAGSLIYFTVVGKPLISFEVGGEKLAFGLMDCLLAAFGVLAIVFNIWVSFQYEKVERQRIWVIIVLLLFTTIFWTFFELAGSAMNLFTDKNINKSIVGITVTTSFFQSVNPFFIMVFAPVVSALWIYMARRNLNLPAPYKFTIGLALLGCGFLAINLGRPFVTAGLMPAIFLILLYLLHTLGELVLSPVGLSLVTKLAPAKIVGFMLGFWFLSSAIALQATKTVGNLATIDDKNAPAEETLNLALKVFNNIGLFTLGAALVLLALSPLLTRWMHGVETNTVTAKAEQEPPMNEGA